MTKKELETKVLDLENRIKALEPKPFEPYSTITIDVDKMMKSGTTTLNSFPSTFTTYTVSNL